MIEKLLKLVCDPQKVKDGAEWRVRMSINTQQVGLLVV